MKILFNLQEDLFVVEAVSLGTLQKVVIGHNAEGLGRIDFYY